MIYTPRAYQELMIEFILKNLRCNVFAGMGMGKTSASIYSFDAMRMFGEARRGLILAPKRVARNTWPKEIDKWNESFGHLKVVAAIGSESERIAALRSNADLVAINYDNIEWLMQVMGDYWDFDTVFADEATRLKGLRVSLVKNKHGTEFLTGQGSVRARAISKVAHKKVRRWINLTGSPAPNGLQDLWGLMWFIDMGRRLGISFSGFQERYFTTIPNESGYHKLIPLASSQRFIEDAIRDVCITVEAKDWFDLKEVKETVLPVQLPPKARRAYDEIEKQLFTLIEENPVQAFSDGALMQKCLQIANGAVYTNPQTKEWVAVHDAKLEALDSVIEEANGESVLVRYTHIPDKERILKRFPKARFLDDNPRTEDEWNEGRIPILVTHAASAGHGLNLQHGGRILCDYSQNYSLEEDEQIIERIGPTRQVQSGYDRMVYRYRLVAEDTIEQDAVIPVIKRKATMQDGLKNAMKVRGFA